MPEDVKPEEVRHGIRFAPGRCYRLVPNPNSSDDSALIGCPFRVEFTGHYPIPAGTVRVESCRVHNDDLLFVTEEPGSDQQVPRSSP